MSGKEFSAMMNDADKGRKESIYEEPVCIKCQAEMREQPQRALVRKHIKDYAGDMPIAVCMGNYTAKIFECPVCHYQVAIATGDIIDEVIIIDSHDF
jgi:hypothetical protein